MISYEWEVFQMSISAGVFLPSVSCAVGCEWCHQSGRLVSQGNTVFWPQTCLDCSAGSFEYSLL